MFDRQEQRERREGMQALIRAGSQVPGAADYAIEEAELRERNAGF